MYTECNTDSYQPYVISSGAFGLPSVKVTADSGLRFLHFLVHLDSLIDELQQTAKHRYVPGCLLTGAYVGAGETGQAVSWLERAYKERDQCMAWINAYPGFDPLRSEPRFQELLRRMNFPQ